MKTKNKNLSIKLGQKEQALLRRAILHIEVKLDQIVIDLGSVELFGQPVVLKHHQYAEEVVRQAKAVKRVVQYMEHILLEDQPFWPIPDMSKDWTYAKLWERYFDAVDLPFDRYDQELRWFGNPDPEGYHDAGGWDGRALERTWNELNRLGGREYRVWDKVYRKVLRYLKQLN
ncbi:MAG: hypothetical protein WC505_06165 [Patescibacteria group bacterium]